MEQGVGQSKSRKKRRAASKNAPPKRSSSTASGASSKPTTGERPSASTRPRISFRPKRGWRKFAGDVLLSVLLGILLGVLVVFVQISRPPEGYTDISQADSGAVARNAERFFAKVQNLLETIQTEGRGVESFSQEEIACFLATLERPEDFPDIRFQSESMSRRIPEKIDNLQVIVEPGLLRFACRYDETWLRRPVVSADIRFDIVDGRLEPHFKAYAGRFPVNNKKIRRTIDAVLDNLLEPFGDRYAVESLLLDDGHLAITVYRRRDAR